MDDQGSTRKLQPQQQPVMANNNSPEMTLASEVFDQFCNANTLKSILGHFRQLCDLLKIKPNTINQFYPKLKAKLRSWKAQALWKKFDQRANHKCYNRGKACPNTRVLIIGGGPCGLRSAIEAQLLGVKVVVVEKRDRMSRNNVLHLWPFVIHDLRGLGAKKFFGKFCAGSIDHISIRQLQCILLKVALILGVEFHESVSFDSLIPPPENQEDGKIGWRAKTTPADHPVSQYEFDVLIGADGKRNTLEGFKRKEFRGKLAIAITANFINKRTEAEARVEEISGVAFIFNQKFFKELYQETGIDLENIVYYKDDTHYFVMTAKKHSLIDKGVILQDHADTAKLLAKENVDREALMLYAREAAEFSTEYQMMDMEFAVNHYGQPDVAMFDFTSMYAAENASRILERHGHKLLMILVGDSLLEPFWPTGSGCARGFLSSLDACWAIKGWGALMPPLEVIAERESIYRLLGQTTPENLNRDYAAYTLDPHTRYPNLNVCSVTPIQVRSLLDTDDPESIKQTVEIDIPKKRRRRDIRGESHVHPDTLLRWLQKQVALYSNIKVEDMGTSFKDGLVICAIIHRYRPDLIDFHHLQRDNHAQNNQLGFDILEKELGIPPIMTGEEMAECDVPDKLAMFSYLTQIYEAFRGEIPQVKYPQLESDEEERAGNTKQLSQLTAEQKVQLISRLARQDNLTRTRHSRSRHNENMNPLEKKGDTIGRRSRKRRSTEKMGATVVERQRKLAEIEKNRIERMKRRQYLRRMATQQFYKSMQMLQANAKREKDEPFEDYSIFLYRQTAPDFKDRVKYLEQKILYPDREPKIHVGHRRPSIDEEFSGRIKNIEDKLRGSTPAEKKPKDLLRAIGKIEKTDWNVKEIEKKIEESKVGRATRHDKVERVPKWSREQFLARQTKMERKGRDQKEADSKYADIDNTLKNIGKKIKEGNVLGHNKVSVMAEQFANKNHDAEPKVQKSNTKTTIALPAQGGSEMCHFCNKRVYLMERLTAEGKFFHRGCFRCEYCSTSLRIGNHTFDRERSGGRFYCTQHFGFSGTMKARAEKKRITAMSNKENIATTGMNVKTPEKIRTGGPLEGVVGLDLLDRGQTPERIEFENLAGMSDAEEAQSQMDEDEWTDRNFGASTAEMGSSDDISDMSDSDDNEIYEEAIDQPLTTEGTLELAKNWTLRYSHSNAAAAQSDTGSNEYEDSSDEYTSEDDESGTATEDEEDIRARELRKQEVWLKQPTRNSDTDTGSETEIASEEDTSSEAEKSEENSATEISTDSEFEHDCAALTQHGIPVITINDSFVRKTRGNYVEPKKVQIKSKVIPPVNGGLMRDKDFESQPQFAKPNEPMICPSTARSEKEKDRGGGKRVGKERECKAVLHDSNEGSQDCINTRMPLMNPRKGDYLLNRTHSTEGIASKLSLELKKKYLLGGSGFGGSVMKSGSASNVDTKLRNLTDAISQHQKLLNPAPEPSPTMQAFLQGTSKLRSSNTQLSLISPTTLFSASPVRACTATVNRSSDNILNSNGSSTYKSVLSDMSKVQLPDLVKESSILKSKTAPNIICGEAKSGKEKESVDKQQINSILNQTSLISRSDEKQNAEAIGDTQNSGNNKFTTNVDETSGFRPRSPLHETSIIVPHVDWSKHKEETKETASTGDSDIDSDSLSSSDEEEVMRNEQLIAMSLSPPRLQIHSTDGDLLLDEKAEKCVGPDESGLTFEPDSIECSFLREDPPPLINDDRPTHLSTNNKTTAKTVMQSTSEVKSAKIEDKIEDHLEKQENSRRNVSNCSSPTSTGSTVSNKQDDSEENDVTTAALTETEFSEWARDGEVIMSDDLRDAEFNINPEFITKRKQTKISDNTGKREFHVRKMPIKMAKEEDLTDAELEYQKSDKRMDLPSNDTSKLLANGENIDFMDTDSESLLEDSLQDTSNRPVIKNRGYVEFVNIKADHLVKPSSCHTRNNEFADTNAPIAKLDLENDSYSEEEVQNKGNVIEINPITMDDVIDKLNGTSSKITGESPANISLDSYDNDDARGDEYQVVEAFNKELFQSMEEDSLLIVEPTEDTTTSEVITILASPVNPQVTLLSTNRSDDTEREERQDLKVVADSSNVDYLEYVKRLQSRIAEFSNAKDSIDVRKSKRKNSKSCLQPRSGETITEDSTNQESTTNNNFNSPATSRKLEEITRERSKQKTLIQDLLMDKLEAHKQKSAEKKAKRAARASSFTVASVLSPTKPTTSCTTPINKFIPTSIVPAADAGDANFAEDARQLSKTECSLWEQQQVSRKLESCNNKTLNTGEQSERRSSPFSSPMLKCPANQQEGILQAPVAPPRLKHEEAKKITEKAWSKSNQSLDLSPEDKTERLKMKTSRRRSLMQEREEQKQVEEEVKGGQEQGVIEKREEREEKGQQLETELENSREEDKALVEQRSKRDVNEAVQVRFQAQSPIELHITSAMKSRQKLQTSKSTDNMKAFADFGGLSTVNAKSMDELLHVAGSAGTAHHFHSSSTPITIQRREKKKPKDPERRRSIIQAVSDFFFKKETPPSPSSQKDKLSMFRLTSKSKGKLFKSYSDGSDLDKIMPSRTNTRPKSVCEGMFMRSFSAENPPPVPPPPLNYTIPAMQASDDSLSEDDTRTTAVSISCAQRASVAEGPSNSIPRKLKAAKRMARQARLKRLRMAQEIQRKLEETEVKQKELENRGVSVEKALRGEGECSDREEADLLREWFDLMKERTELRRYERELLVRAQEVQLEDRYERLQQELRERLADDDDKKTTADVKKEGEILTEMLEIVAKRDSLIALLEEERQRYQDEDRDLEAQMLAKGLRLTPIKKCGSKYSV